MFRNDLPILAFMWEMERTVVKTHPVTFQDTQNSYKVKMFLTHFAIVLETFSGVCFWVPVYSRLAFFSIPPEVE